MNPEPNGLTRGGSLGYVRGPGPRRAYFRELLAQPSGPQPAQAAVTEAWMQRYGSEAGSEDRANKVVTDAAGNVIVAGSTENQTRSGSDLLVIKYSGAGLPLWTNRTANSGASAMAVNGSGNVFVTGWSVGSGGDSDYATIAYSGAGLPLWTNRYNGTGNGSDQATAVAVDPSGRVFVTGSSFGSGGSSEYATIAYSGAGVPLWTNRYNGPENGYDQASALAVDGRGNVVVTGFSSGDYYTAKYAAADGALLWEKRYNGPGNGGDQANAVAVDGSGNVVVTGSSNGDYYTAKYAAVDGALLWEKRYNGPKNGHDQATAVAVDGSGNVVVTGRLDGFIISLNNSTGGDYYTAKYAAADGATLWEKRFNTLNSGGSSPCLALGPNGMIAVSGTSSGDYATIVYREVPAVSIDLISTGVRLRVTGLPDRSYNIERTPVLTGPWSTINTQAAPASGLLEYLDTNPPAPAAFYRASEP